MQRAHISRGTAPCGRIQQARRVQGRGRSASTKCRAAESSSEADSVDLFDVLGVSPADGQEAVRAAYLALIRRAHPDVAGNQGTKQSALLNAAYDTLSDPVKRSAYLRKQQGVRQKATGRKQAAGQPGSRSGLVGPLYDEILLTRLVPRQSKAVPAMEEVRDAVREFLKTFTFTNELPLPVPIQVDDTVDGCRVAFCTITSGALESLGALHFSFAHLECDLDDAYKCDWEIVVQRRCPVSMEHPRALPGEARILQAVLTEFDALQTMGQQTRGALFQIPAFFSFLFAALPVGLGLDGGTGGDYRQYNLQRACRLDSRPQH